jgi:hypothetical protein
MIKVLAAFRPSANANVAADVGGSSPPRSLSTQMPNSATARAINGIAAIGDELDSAVRICTRNNSAAKESPANVTQGHPSIALLLLQTVNGMSPPPAVYKRVHHEILRFDKLLSYLLLNVNSPSHLH